MVIRRHDMCANRRFIEEKMTSQEMATKNSKELTEFFKDRWTEEQYDKYVKLDELAEYNMEINRGNNERI